eukprot:403340659
MPYVFGLQKIQEGGAVLYQRCGCNVIIHAITKGEIKSVEEIKQQVKQNQPKTFNRFMCKIVHFMNNYYLKEVLDPLELSQLFDRAFIEVQDEFYNEQDVLEYIRTKVATIRFKHEELQFKMFLIKKFVSPPKNSDSQTPLNQNSESYEGKSSVIFIYNHVISDGIGGLLALNTIQDKFDLDNLPTIRTTPWLQTAKDMFIGLFFPFYNSQLEEALDKPLQENPMLKFVKNQSEYNLTKDYCVSDVKLITKQLKCTINDFCMTAIGIAIRKYADRHQLNIKDTMQFGLAVSLRNKPNHKEDVTFNNQFRGQKTHIKIPSSTSTDDILASLKENTQCGNVVRDMPYIYGNLYKIRLMTYLMPLFLLKKVIGGTLRDSCKFTSNIGGQPKPIKLGKNAFTEKLHFTSSLSENDFDLDIKSLIFNIMSHNDIFRISINYLHMNIDGKDIISFLESAFDDLRQISKQNS